MAEAKVAEVEVTEVKVINYTIKGSPIFKRMRTDVVDEFGRTWYHRSRSATFGSVEDRMKNEEGVVLWVMHKPMFGSSVTIKSEHFNANITLHRYGVLKLGFDFEQEGQRFKLKKLGVIGENFHLIHAESLEPVFTFDWTYLSMSKRGDLHLFPEAMRKYRFEESFLIALALVYLDMVEDSHHHG